MGKQIVHRVASDMEAHGGFPGYYPVVSALVFYPWSALMPAALAGAWARRKADPALGFLLGWIVGPLILLECFRTKLIHYYLPAFPSCALLVAWLVLALAAEGVNIRRRPLGRLSMAHLVGIGLALAAILLAAVRDWCAGKLGLLAGTDRGDRRRRDARRHVEVPGRCAGDGPCSRWRVLGL